MNKKLQQIILVAILASTALFSCQKNSYSKEEITGS